MKGFTKDGKFRPTGNKSKSSLKKTDVKRKITITSGKIRTKENIDKTKKELADEIIDIRDGLEEQYYDESVVDAKVMIRQNPKKYGLTKDDVDNE